MDAYKSLLSPFPRFTERWFMSEAATPGLKEAMRLMASSPHEKAIRAMRGNPAFDSIAAAIGHRALCPAQPSEVNQHRPRFRVIDGGVTSWKRPRDA